MSTMTRLAEVCKVCNKPTKLFMEVPITRSDGQEVIARHYTCGHMQVVKLEKSFEDILRNVENPLGQKLYDFQVTANDFCRKSNYRCLLNLDTGTGKTVIISALLGVNTELSPVLIVCKSSLRSHWRTCIKQWSGRESQVIETGNDYLLTDIIPVTIISFDMLPKYQPEQFSKYKLLIIDETQNIKSQTALRTHAVRKVSAIVPHIIGLSATPIKNHAGEYYTILNILRPDIFWSYPSFTNRYVATYTKNGYSKLGGLRNIDQFFRQTGDYILRMKREDVLPHLPKTNRTYLYTDLESSVRAAYAKALKELGEAYDRGELEGSGGMSTIIEYLTLMRRLTGISKVRPTVEYAVKFLEDNPDEKLVIFIHHRTVGKLLMESFESFRFDEDGKELFTKPVMMDADALGKEGQTLVNRFRDGKDRIAIVSTIAGGEGLNFQPISNCIMMERQWNPSNEKQALDRFPRPGATASVINAKYILAIGTIDEYMTELNEKKWAYLTGAVEGKQINWSESSILKDIAYLLATKGRQAWSW